MSAWARAAVHHPLAALGLLGVVTLALAAGLPRLATDVGYRAFLGASHPSVVRFDAFVERFGGGLPMAAVWSCKQATACDDVFDESALAMAARIERRLAGAFGIVSVASPASAPLVVPTPEGPVVRTFRTLAGSAPDRSALAERARADPAWAGQLISSDGTVGAVVVELAGSDSVVAAQAYAALDAALAPEEAAGVDFHRVGGPVEFVVAGGELEAATARLIPIMVGLVAVILVLLFHSVAVAGAVLASVGLAVVWTIGLLGWLSAFGWAQNSLTQTLPPLVLVIGVCDGIHLLARHANAVLDRPPTDAAERAALVQESASAVAAPCLMTTLTTMAGFLAFSTARLESFVQFGLLAAAGVLFALILCFTLLPILLLYVTPERLHARRASHAWRRVLAALLRAPERHARAVVAVSVGVALLCALGMTRLEVDASFEELYGEQSAVVRWARFVSDNLRRPDTLEVELQLPEGAALEDPAVLGAVDRAARELDAIDTLGPARSAVSSLAWIHRLLRGDDPTYQRISDDPEENAVLLTLARSFGGPGGGGDGLRRWIDSEGRAMRVSVESGKTPQEPLRRAMERVDELLATGLPDGWRGIATGPLAVVHDMIDDIRSTQIRSFAGAGLAVLVLVWLYLRSVTGVLLAFVPTLLPVILTLGTMGLLGIPLDVGSAMVAAVVLGIAVDDAIHVLDRFRRNLDAGLAAPEAVHEALLHVGRALVTTSLALTVGFSALALSPWKSVASFGLVSAIAIAGALVACLVVLPALVLVVNGRQNSPAGT